MDVQRVGYHNHKLPGEKKIKHSSDCTAEMTVLIINLQSQLKNQEEEKSC